MGPQQGAGNLRKHKVSVTEAATALGDFLGTTASDPDHSADEHRYITIELSNRGRLPMVAHILAVWTFKPLLLTPMSMS
jgi:uncharacterized protein